MEYRLKFFSNFVSHNTLTVARNVGIVHLHLKAETCNQANDDSTYSSLLFFEIDCSRVFTVIGTIRNR